MLVPFELSQTKDFQLADGGDPPRHGGRGRGEGGDPPAAPTVEFPLQLK